MIPPSDLLVSPEALQTRRWVRSLRAELSAFDELTKIPDADPRRTVQCLIDTVVRLYGAGSAGISVLRPGSHGHAYFVWEVVSGALAAHRGDGTPGNHSPCGFCLDIGTAIVLARPERAFSYLARVQPAICETLTVPLYNHDGTPLGTLWVMHHEPTKCFGADDVLVIERLSQVTAVALKRMQADHPAMPGDRSRSAGSMQPTSGRYETYRTSGPAREN
jgi:GAF domain-containing protein